MSISTRAPRSSRGAPLEASRARGLANRITISHGCALSVLDERECARPFAGLHRAGSGVTLMALPETNLFLQDRRSAPHLNCAASRWRARSAAAGGKVRLGTDNVRDWFFPFGDGDMLDTALFALAADPASRFSRGPAHRRALRRYRLRAARHRPRHLCSRPRLRSMTRSRGGQISGASIASPPVVLSPRSRFEPPRLRQDHARHEVAANFFDMMQETTGRCASVNRAGA